MTNYSTAHAHEGQSQLLRQFQDDLRFVSALRFNKLEGLMGPPWTK